MYPFNIGFVTLKQKCQNIHFQNLYFLIYWFIILEHKIDGGTEINDGDSQMLTTIHGEMYIVYNTYAHINCIKEKFQATSESIQQHMLSSKNYNYATICSSSLNLY